MIPMKLFNFTPVGERFALVTAFLVFWQTSAEGAQKASRSWGAGSEGTVRDSTNAVWIPGGRRRLAQSAYKPDALSNDEVRAFFHACGAAGSALMEVAGSISQAYGRNRHTRVGTGALVRRIHLEHCVAWPPHRPSRRNQP